MSDWVGWLIEHNREVYARREIVGEVQDMIDAVWAEGIDTETAAKNIVDYFLKGAGRGLS